METTQITSTTKLMFMNEHLLMINFRNKNSHIAESSVNRRLLFFIWKKNILNNSRLNNCDDNIDYRAIIVSRTGQRLP